MKRISEEQRVSLAVQIIQEEHKKHPDDKKITMLKERFDRSF